MGRFRRGPIVLALALCGLVSTAAASPTPTEYPVPTKDRSPVGVTAGPDGAVWFAESAGGGGIGRVAPGGAFNEYTTGLSNPAESITLGPDGNLWFTEPGGSKVGRITPSGTITEFPLAGGVHPGTIVTGPDGNLWFTVENGVGAIDRMTTGGTLSEFTTGLTASSQPHGIAAGPDGNLWFTESGGPGRIGRITTAGTITEFTAGLTEKAKPWEITAGPDGNLWFTEKAGSGAIGRITTTGSIHEYKSGLTATSEPDAITAGNDGNVYFTEAKNPGRVAMITPAGAITETATPTSNSQPEGIATGPDGKIWFTEVGNHGLIGTMAVAPGVSARSPSSIGESAATLAASVDPDSQSTEVDFEYGATGAYGSHTAKVAVGAGSAAVLGSIAVSGLTAATTYHYRAVASNETGTTYGPDQTFTTIAPPSASTGSASSVSLTGATFEGTVNPQGHATEYRFEWGPTSAYGASTPALEAGSDSTVHPLAAPVTGLEPNRLYHFRIAATNCGWCEEGTSYGADQTFASAPPPAALTGGAEAIGTSAATLTGAANPHGAATTYHFEWGPSSAYGNDAPAVDQAVGSDSTEHRLAQPIAGLLEGVTYHYRLVASNCGGCSAGTVDGADTTFRTGSALVAPPPAGTSPTGAAAPPVLGATALAQVQAGTILYIPSGSSVARTLSGAADIPMGSLIDARHGTLALTTATDAKGDTQTALVWGSRFRVTQAASVGGMTTLTLAAGRPAGCPRVRPGRAHKAALVARARKAETLWGHDRHGHFSTRGNNSVATVRGTYWGTSETCSGTLTTVREGAVSVRPRHGRTVLVRAGHSYLARG